MSDSKAAEQIDRNANQYLTVKYLNGLCEYEKVWHAMQDFTDARNSQSEDQIWVLQHLPVYTQGQAGRPEHVLNPNGIPVVQVDRGGQVTFHGPGQLVVYILFDIDRMGIGTRRLVTLIETSMIETLALYGIKAEARKDAPGVYIDGKKIGSVGLRIRKGRSFHGLSLNIDMDLSPFQGINPCGYAGMEMTQLAAFEGAEPLEQVAGRMVGEIARQFNFQGVQMEYVEQV